MPSEITIALSAPLTGVELTDPDAPLLAGSPAPAGPRETEQGQQRREEQERHWREERAAIEQAVAGMTAAARNLEEQHRGRLAEMRRVAVELGVTIAARLLHEKVRADDFAVEELVRQVVGRLETQQPVTVRLHPADLALLERRLGGQSLSHGAAEVRVAADPSLRRGDCRAESGDVSVLAQLAEQLTEIRHHLLGSLENAGPGP